MLDDLSFEKFSNCREARIAKKLTCQRPSLLFLQDFDAFDPESISDFSLSTTETTISSLQLLGERYQLAFIEGQDMLKHDEKQSHWDV